MDDYTRYSMTQPYESDGASPDESTAARLLVISGPLNGKSFSLEADFVTIGRLKENRICIADPAVSKVHCTIMREADRRFFVIDQGSTNGTEVNGRALRPGRRLELANGDTIHICGSTFFFLNPRGAGGADSGEEIKIDFGAAAAEAAEVLKDCAEIIALRDTRRKKR